MVTNRECDDRHKAERRYVDSEFINLRRELKLTRNLVLVLLTVVAGQTPFIVF